MRHSSFRANYSQTLLPGKVLPIDSTSVQTFIPNFVPNFVQTAVEAPRVAWWSRGKGLLVGLSLISLVALGCLPVGACGRSIDPLSTSEQPPAGSNGESDRESDKPLDQKLDKELDQEEVVVTGQGIAAYTGDIVAAQEEAIWDAKRNAVEQAAGIFLKARTVGSDFRLEEDEIRGRTQGFVRRWEVIEGTRRIETLNSPGGDTGKMRQILHIEVRATIGLLPLVRKLADIADVYKDLERPRLRVEIVPSEITAKSGPAVRQKAIVGLEERIDTARRVQTAISGALRMQGFDVASEGAAEVVLKGTLDLVPTVRLGDRSAPYGVGDSLAACRGSLTLRAVSVASEDLLFARRIEATGRSFESDVEALHAVAAELAEAVLDENAQQFVDHLLVRWAHERQEGHVVVVRVVGINVSESAQLRTRLEEMRGFLRFVEPPTEDLVPLAKGSPISNGAGIPSSGNKKGGASSSALRPVRRVTWRFLTRRDMRSLRRDLAGIASLLSDSHSGGARRQLVLLNDRGPVIECAVRPSASIAH